MTTSPPRPRPVVVAIDGPAGSGKSTLAKALAKALGDGWRYLDTGAMYRAVTVVALRRGVPVADEPAVARLAKGLALHVDAATGRVTVDGDDLTDAIRTAEVNAAVSAVAANAAVREVMRAHQRRYAAEAGRVVAEGRDIGTAVFPDAAVKVFLDAAPDERVRRRVDETRAKGGTPDAEEVRRALLERDRLDATRAADPLARAGDAVHLDTTGLAPAQVVERVRALVLSRVPPVAGR
jgi:cytidylate kinase